MDLAYSVRSRICSSLLSYLGDALIDSRQPFLSFAARIADGLNLFKLILDHEGPISSYKLASISEGDELLIGRYGFRLQRLLQKCKKLTAREAVF